MANYFFDDNHAWFHGIPEYCLRSGCRHQRCALCHDPGPALWPIQYADGRPIQHLFRELQISLGDNEDDDGDDDVRVSDSNSSSDSNGDANSVIEISSDEERGRSSVKIPSRRSKSKGAEHSKERYPCPVRDTHLCPYVFQSEDAAWRHSRVHVGEDMIKCARKGCAKTFGGKQEMRLHYIEAHS